jgi:uncharacterized protein YydD (DUF2326 family)
MAVVRARMAQGFPAFLFHDGIFESLDNRKKENLVGVIRRYTDLRVQHVITLIDSDLPEHAAGAAPMFEPEEIVLTLHDEGEDGRLFKMRSW